jgi:hypothetical protein
MTGTLHRAAALRLVALATSVAAAWMRWTAGAPIGAALVGRRRAHSR